jgi:hypothetical protein
MGCSGVLEKHGHGFMDKTGSLDTVKYGLLLVALHRLDLASLASFPTTLHDLTLSIHVVKMNPSPEKITWLLSQNLATTVGS